MNYDEICKTCGYPRGEHTTKNLVWMTNKDGVEREINFWQDGICPWFHNMTQPPWDLYFFNGESEHVRSNRPEWSKRY